MFDKYFRGRLPYGRTVPGIGLGLPVSRELVEAHNGRIWAESKIGEELRSIFRCRVTA
ncbi:MAG: hypothetical protein H6654_08025 [Ardenticatenaceae bacterium]|nr:hypothetical protein [Ardenticatenaceae bacterium]